MVAASDGRGPGQCGAPSPLSLGRTLGAIGYRLV